MARIDLKRRGIIRLNRDFIDSADFETLSSLFVKVIPVWCQYQFHNNTIKYHCLSELFSCVDEGTITPEYLAWFAEGESGVGIFSHVTMVDIFKITQNETTKSEG